MRIEKFIYKIPSTGHMVQNWDNVDFEIILRLIKGNIHLRELSKEIKIPHSTISRRLISLRKQLVLDYNIEGKNKSYFLKKNLIAQKAIIMSENYKCIKIFSKYPQIIPICQDTLNKSKSNIIILFGSYAKETPKEDSDIDIYIETTNSKEKENIQKINDLLSIKIGKFNPEELLIKEIIKNHVIIKGAEEYYKKLKFFR
jgi:predicted nucleotidyltransferase